MDRIRSSYGKEEGKETEKSASYGEIVSRLKEVKELEMNLPRLNPPDSFILGKNMGFIVLGQEE